MVCWDDISFPDPLVLKSEAENLSRSLRDGNGDGGDVDLQQPAEPDDQEVAMWILDTRRSPRRWTRKKLRASGVKCDSADPDGVKCFYTNQFRRELLCPAHLWLTLFIREKPFNPKQEILLFPTPKIPFNLKRDISFNIKQEMIS